jgi:hypothetical protein
VTEKPRPPVPQQATRPAPPVQKPAEPSVSDALRETGRNLVSQQIEKRPYLKMAFGNFYNLSLFGGAMAASVLTLNPVLAVAAIGLEGLWLLHAPDSKRLQHLLWDPQFAALKEALDARQRFERMKGISPEERARVEGIVSRQKQIRELAARNPSFAGDLLRGELMKTDRLVDAFVEMCITCARYRQYLDSVDEDQLEKVRRRYEAGVKLKGDDETAGLAQKNLDVVTKRLEKVLEIKRYLSRAEGQLDLIENSFQLIADQIVTMQSPQELTGQLDELLDGVQAIRDTARDTEKILGEL